MSKVCDFCDFCGLLKTVRKSLIFKYISTKLHSTFATFETISAKVTFRILISLDFCDFCDFYP